MEKLNKYFLIKLFFLALLIATFHVILSKYDPFGIKTVTNIHSESVFMQLIGGPWYQSKTQEKITVVLIDDQYLEKTNDFWPMPYRHQAQLLMNILDFNPTAVYLDIIYRHDHGSKKSDMEQLRELLIQPSSSETNANTIPKFFIPYLTIPQSKFSSCNPDDYPSSAKDFVNKRSIIMESPHVEDVYVGWEGCGNQYPAFILGDKTHKTPAFTLFQYLCRQSDFFSHSNGCKEILAKNSDYLDLFKKPMAVQWGISVTDIHQMLLTETIESDESEKHGVKCSMIANNSSFFDRLKSSLSQLSEMFYQSFDANTMRGKLAPCTYIDTLHATWFLGDRTDESTEVMEKLIENRIVLVGTQLDGINDNVINPVNGMVPGVYLLAMALDNYLEFGADYHKSMNGAFAVFLEIIVLFVIVFINHLIFVCVRQKFTKKISVFLLGILFKLIPLILSFLFALIVWHYNYVPFNWISVAVLSVFAAPKIAISQCYDFLYKKWVS